MSGPGEVAVGGDDPRGVPEVVPDRGGCGDAAILLTGGAVQVIGGFPEDTTAERGGSYPRCVCGGLGGISGGIGVGGGTARAQVVRARIVLLATEGLENAVIAVRLDVRPGVVLLDDV
jgi:hypothetical protein